MKKYETDSWEETFKIGKKLAGILKPGAVVALDGDLGAGKTVFAKGFATGLGIDETISSPTFTIVNVYEDGRMPFYHFDVYRISDIEEMYEIGCDDYFYGEGVCLVEWASMIEDILPDDTIRVSISKDMDRGDNFRTIIIESELMDEED